MAQVLNASKSVNNLTINAYFDILLIKGSNITLPW